MASQESIRSEASRPVSGVMTFLFADIRGYTRFTAEHGDEAAARLATRFAAIAREAIAADALYWLGDAAMLRTEMELAGARFGEAEDIYARLGHVDGRAWMRSARGAVLQGAGRYDEAVELLEESLRLYRPGDQGTNPAITRLNLGEAYYGQGRLDAADTEYCGCLTMLRGQSSPEVPLVVAWTLAAQAQLAAVRGEFERAAHLLGARAAIRPPMMIFPAERAELEHAERLTCAALGDDAYALALAAMQSVGVDEAIAFGLDIGTCG